jgi:hypothetical protein
MIRFATLAELRGFAATTEAQLATKSATNVQNKTVFLSHSTADHDALPGVVTVLEGHGGRVYVDDRDVELAGLDMHGKAERLRKAVTACRKLVLFVTPKSKDSYWVTWELALGDGVNMPHNVALFPSAENLFEMEWANQEYLGLYRRIVWGNYEGYTDPLWMVIDHRTNNADRLGSWLSA